MADKDDEVIAGDFPEATGREPIETSGPAATFPMFYRRPEPLTAEAHGKLGIRAGVDYGFARATNVLPINSVEFPLAARSYPIVFVGGEHPAGLAIVGVRNGENLFIESDGNWSRGHYIPAYVRRYPFVFMHNPNDNQFVLCIDRASDRVGEAVETPLFADGKATEFTQRALDFCTAYQQQHVASQRAFALLHELHLLKSNQGSLKLPGGQTIALTDFKIVDEQKLNALPDADFLRLRKDGALAMIYCHLMSMMAWQGLVERAN